MAGMNLKVGIKDLKRGTNILNVDVPKQLRKRIRTGIEWYDDAIAGGFVPSAVKMVTGGPGCGKTTLLLQLADALTGQGHIALYNTGEESLYQVRMVTERLDIQHGFIVGQDILVKDTLSHVNSLAKQHPGKQVILLQDSLQTMDDGKYGNGTNGATPLRCVELLTDWAKEKFGIVIFIGQVNKDGEFQGKNGILHATDLRGKLFIDQAKNSPTYGERIYEITKNRFGCNGLSYILGMSAKGLYEKGNFDKTKV